MPPPASRRPTWPLVPGFSTPREVSLLCLGPRAGLLLLLLLMRARC
jgi:hypothetical protein